MFKPTLLVKSVKVGILSGEAVTRINLGADAPRPILTTPASRRWLICHTSGVTPSKRRHVIGLFFALFPVTLNRLSMATEDDSCYYWWNIWKRLVICNMMSVLIYNTYIIRRPSDFYNNCWNKLIIIFNRYFEHTMFGYVSIKFVCTWSGGVNTVSFTSKEFTPTYCVTTESINLNLSLLSDLAMFTLA